MHQGAAPYDRGFGTSLPRAAHAVAKPGRRTSASTFAVCGLIGEQDCGTLVEPIVLLLRRLQKEPCECNRRFRSRSEISLRPRPSPRMWKSALPSSILLRPHRQMSRRGRGTAPPLRHGQRFHVRIDLHVPGKELVVSKNPDDAKEDAYAASTMRSRDAERVLEDFADVAQGRYEAAPEAAARRRLEAVPGSGLRIHRGRRRTARSTSTRTACSASLRQAVGRCEA